MRAETLQTSQKLRVCSSGLSLKGYTSGRGKWFPDGSKKSNGEKRKGKISKLKHILTG